MAEVKHWTREGWLTAGMELLNKEFFAGRGHEMPTKVRASCGFPKGSTGRGRAIGQCWTDEVSGDQHYEIFICPTQAEPVRVLDILLHEMVHACVGIEAGHKGPFRKLAKEFGLAGKMTATYAEEGGELWNKLSSMAQELGPYPHAAMVPTNKKKARKDNRVRYRSINEPTYTVTISCKKVEEFGEPMDPWGDEMELVEPEVKDNRPVQVGCASSNCADTAEVEHEAQPTEQAMAGPPPLDKELVKKLAWEALALDLKIRYDCCEGDMERVVDAVLLGVRAQGYTLVPEGDEVVRLRRHLRNIYDASRGALEGAAPA